MEPPPTTPPPPPQPEVCLQSSWAGLYQGLRTLRMYQFQEQEAVDLLDGKKTKTKRQGPLIKCRSHGDTIPRLPALSLQSSELRDGIMTGSVPGLECWLLHWPSFNVGQVDSSHCVSLSPLLQEAKSTCYLGSCGAD